MAKTTNYPAPVRRVMVVVGTRPEAIKLAPVILALEAAAEFLPIVVVTGQHREMLDQVMQTFGIVPKHDLDIMGAGQTLTDVTTRVLERLGPIITADQPDAVVVQGDTTTAFAGALAAFYQQVPVVHVEAGLRTGDVYSPYPEEMNRRLVGQLAAMHLAPTPTSRANLLAENVDPSAVIVTGNTVIDALLWTVGRPLNEEESLLPTLREGKVLLVTAHRRESWGEGMESVGRALRRLAIAEPGLEIVFPIHRNPLVREAIAPAVEGLDNVHIIEPLSYAPFAHLMQRADIILTDSGGVQEEGPSLGKPVLVMRENTERPEAVHAGTVRMVSTDEETIVSSVRTLLHDGDEYDRMANAVNPYGDGEAARRTVEALRHFLAGAPRPDEFSPRSHGVESDADGGAAVPEPL